MLSGCESSRNQAELCSTLCGILPPHRPIFQSRVTESVPIAKKMTPRVLLSAMDDEGGEVDLTIDPLIKLSRSAELVANVGNEYVASLFRDAFTFRISARYHRRSLRGIVQDVVASGITSGVNLQFETGIAEHVEFAERDGGVGRVINDAAGGIAQSIERSVTEKKVQNDHVELLVKVFYPMKDSAIVGVHEAYLTLRKNLRAQLQRVYKACGYDDDKAYKKAQDYVHAIDSRMHRMKGTVPASPCLCQAPRTVL